ncbi:MAG: NAD(P)H-dependent glycerol-3-phosphate dehydrogenase [Ruminococcaceae bacterium]|nr:NAD(P)H-dependent glycerol-3-phosphate dehydrogenase [Oscillospiraceae bacterium]
MAVISVIGSGGWGTALSVMLSKNSHQVTLWSLFKEEIDALEKDRENKLLKGVKIPKDIFLTSDLKEIPASDVYVLAVPSFAIRSTARLLKNILKENDVVCNISKGLEEETLLRMSQVIKEELPFCKLAVLSGPSHAEEVARGIPTTNVVGSEDLELAKKLQDIFMNKSFRIYTSDDIIGMELGGSLKNVIALAAGCCDGMGLGDNTKAALMTRGIAEMERLGVALGAKASTFTGLTGFGDLIVTCTSMHSRNRRCGILIGQGKTAKEAIEEVGMTVEGYKTAAAAYMLSQKVNVDMPIITEIYNVLYKDKKATEAINDLMLRTKKNETEEVWS